MDHRRTMAAVLDVWNGASADGLEPLLASGYRGHMLGVPGGERVGAGYAEVISQFRTANPGAAFRVIEQFDAGDRCVSRLEASRPVPDERGRVVSHGINISRFDDDGRLAEEWAIWSAWLEGTSRETA